MSTLFQRCPREALDRLRTSIRTSEKLLQKNNLVVSCDFPSLETNDVDAAP